MLNMNAVWIDRYRLAIELPESAEPAQLVGLVDDLQTALESMNYGYRLLSSGKVLADSDFKSTR